MLNHQPKDGKCPYCEHQDRASQAMRRHVKKNHVGGLEKMDAGKREKEAAILESNAAAMEQDAPNHDDAEADQMIGTAKNMRYAAKGKRIRARMLRAKGERRDRVAEVAAMMEDCGKEMAATAEKMKGALKYVVIAKKGKVIAGQTATAQCASTPSKAPRPFNISRGLKPATKSSLDKSLREQYKESSALGFTTEEESSTASESDDEPDGSPAADTNTPKSTVASRNPLPPGLRSTQSVSSPAAKLKYPAALLAAVQGLDNLINPLLKEEIAADASSLTALLAATGDKAGAEVANVVEAATQLLQQLAAANTGRYNALGELQNGVVEIAKKRESQLEALEREVALLKQQMK